MEALYKKVVRYLDILNEQRAISLGKITNVRYCPCDYKGAGELPKDEALVPFDTQKDTWGNGYDSHAWFKFNVTVPEDCDPNDVFIKVITNFPTGWDPDNPQFIAYIDGKMIQGLDINHTRLYFSSPGEHEVILYAYTGIKPMSAKLSLELFKLNREVEKLWYDIYTPFETLSYLDKNSGEYRNILNMLSKAFDLVELYLVPSEEFYRSVSVASKYMDEEFYGKYCSAHETFVTVTGVGHTHIDCAWLWTLKQTREKVQRSFSTVLELMRRYPEYKFMSSQAFLYQNLKEEAPELYDEIREHIKSGRWECEGAMWVEADCNLSSGESLVRQVVYGKRFFKEEFGVDNNILWLPDVFGYSAALPQILKKNGIDWFVTTKIGWNDTNMMPYDTFMWKGLDGSEINTYFLSAQRIAPDRIPTRHTTYVGRTNPVVVAGTYNRFQQKELTPEVLLTFGFGDGGGGPTEDHLEMARRLEKGIPGTPVFKMDFAGNFLSRLKERVENNPRLPVWQGELYLEFHRGTYTSQAKNKKNNRRSEELYLNTELICSINNQLLSTAFPKAELHRGWEMLLTNQFHDIIPGSSIKQVYEQCDKDYAEIQRIAHMHLDPALGAIAKNIDASEGYVVFNPNPTTGSGIVKVDGVSAYVENIPAKGYACVKSLKTQNSVKTSESSCENDFFRIEFDGNMNISSIYDKKNCREVIREGGVGNQFRVYADYPDQYDAWEWSEYTIDKYSTIDQVESVEQISDGVRAGLRIVRKYMSSTFTQNVWLYDDIDRIDFETIVDWREKHQGIKTAFDVNINSSRATYEIQYGTAERPTHKNTSWDRAKYEVCGHRFADFSEGNYGVSLLNDCKYGYDIHGTTMTLTLLRAPTYPDSDADMGENRFTYSIYPHEGAMNAAKLYAHAYELNNPMTVIRACGNQNMIPTSYSMAKVDKSNILCEVVKQAEDGEDLVFRFFECSNSVTRAEITFGFDVESVWLCDMGENTIHALAVKNNTVSLPFGAFEIHTLKVTAKK
ncbi:MAG: alpha-mannosidase [Ruminococcaceae bacterium]|nr:alpha-mannosidase [Oscillospiraceae bacterium]